MVQRLYERKSTSLSLAHQKEIENALKRLSDSIQEKNVPEALFYANILQQTAQ